MKNNSLILDVIVVCCASAWTMGAEDMYYPAEGHFHSVDCSFQELFGVGSIDTVSLRGQYIFSEDYGSGEEYRTVITSKIGNADTAFWQELLTDTTAKIFVRDTAGPILAQCYPRTMIGVTIGSRNASHRIDFFVCERETAFAHATVRKEKMLYKIVFQGNQIEALNRYFRLHMERAVPRDLQFGW